MEGKAKGKQKGRKRKEAVNEGKKEKVVDKGRKEEEVEVIKGVFSDKTIDLLQIYYSNAIHSHIGDLEGMKRACWAVFYHSISTDDLHIMAHTQHVIDTPIDMEHRLCFKKI